MTQKLVAFSAAFVTVVCIVTMASCSRTASAAPIIVDPGQGLVALTISDPAGEELSGIAHADGNTYWAVGDTAAKAFKLQIDLNTTDGTITAAELLDVTNTVDLTDAGADQEGIALVNANTAMISNESGPGIHTHDLTTGNRSDQITPATHPQLAVFSNTVANFGWESMTRRADGNETWTANEEALTVDGSLSTGSAGTTVRLQKFDSSTTPAGQWAYNTDPITGAGGTSLDRSGVSDLLILDNGTLLVLERSFGTNLTTGGFHIRIYAVDFTGATDVSAAPFDDGLIGETYTPVAKTLLWEQTFDLFSAANIEGMTLGPTLDDGSRSLLLVSDNQGAASTFVYPLKIVPEPATVSLIALPALAIGARKNTR